MVRVRCVRFFKSVGPGYGEPVDDHPRLRLGEEYVVLSVLVCEWPWNVGLQLLDPDDEWRWSWEPAGMFETVSTAIPSNWVTQLNSDGSLRLAPEAWLEPGFHEGYVNGERNGPAAREIFERERAVILDEA
jgi:hypothetical protein